MQSASKKKNGSFCAVHSPRIAVRTRPLLLRHAVPSARILCQPVRTSAQLCQRLPPAALPDAYKIWCRAMRVNASAASYIIYIGSVLGALNVAKLLNKMQQKLLLGVPDRGGLRGLQINCDAILTHHLCHSSRPRRMSAATTVCTRQFCTCLECLVHQAA